MHYPCQLVKESLTGLHALQKENHSTQCFSHRPTDGPSRGLEEAGVFQPFIERTQILPNVNTQTRPDVDRHKLYPMWTHKTVPDVNAHKLDLT